MKRMRALALAGWICVIAGLLPSAADALPQNFSDTTVFQGLNAPTSVAFAPDGRVFVAEQGGLIKVYDGPTDTTATTFADLRTQVHGFWDRGLESLIIDPQFPARPYVYVSYTYDAPIGGTAPTWGIAGQDGDGCSTPPGPTDDGCVVSGRLSRLTVAGNGTGNTMAAGGEKVLINDWCQQYPSHSVGDLGFGADGNLYMSAGDGASFVFADYGQDGNPINPCGDPPFGVGRAGTQATGEGGALRSQDVRTSGDPLGLDGSLIRVDPDTGNPISGTGNAGRQVAFGFRNPFRFAIRPGTNPPEVWVGDVGWGTVEEIDRVQTQAGVSGTTGNNFGWPCLEGPTYKPYADEGFCQSLYTKTGAEVPKAPYYSFIHGQRLDSAESQQPAGTCTLDGGSSITGMEFYDGGSGAFKYPSAYDGSLFFADYARNCIWVMKAGTNGLPDTTKVSVFEGTAGPVDLENAPDGSLYYVSLNQGKVHRIAYESTNHAPVARATATPDHGVAPLQVQLSASTSTDADAGDQLTYAWDLDADGQFDDSTSINPTKTYSTEGKYRPRVKVTDREGASSQAEVLVDVGAPPVPSITTPQDGVEFDPNETFGFSGSATDVKDGSIAASGLHWSAVLNHCVTGGGCHTHNVQTFDGVSSGQMAMPSHDRPYYLTLTLTATDSDGLQASVSRDIYPTPENTDNTPPDTTIDSGPNGPTNNKTPTFDFSSNESGSTYECKVDSGSFSSCNSPKTLGSLSDGNHTFTVRATDAAGNTDPSPATRSFKVDTAPPTVSLSCPPAPAVSTTSPVRCTGTWNDPGGANASGIPFGGIIYALDTDPGAATNYTGNFYSGPFNVSGDGTFDVVLLAVDRAGNVSSFDVAKVKIDTKPPETTIDSGPNGPTTNKTPTFGFSSDEPGSTFECKLDAGSFASCDPPKTVASLADGDHTFSVRATDSTADTDPTPAVRNFTVDTTPPDTTIDSGPNGPTNNKTPTFDFSSNESGSTFECKLDTGSFASCNPPKTLAALADGSHTISVRATDAAGNTDPSPATRSFKVDTAPPTVSLSCPPAPAVSATSPVRCTGTWNDPGGSNASGIPFGGVIYALDNDPGAATNYIGNFYSAPFDVSGDGTFDVVLLAVDRAGNVSSFATVQVRINTGS